MHMILFDIPLDEINIKRKNSKLNSMEISPQ